MVLVSDARHEVWISVLETSGHIAGGQLLFYWCKEVSHCKFVLGLSCSKCCAELQFQFTKLDLKFADQTARQARIIRDR